MTADPRALPATVPFPAGPSGLAAKKDPPMFQRVLCVYPYRHELGDVNFFPPLGLECIAAVLAPHARAIDIVDLRKDRGRARDFLRPETDLVCFSINWDREAAFVREEIRSIPPEIFTLLGGRHATLDPQHWFDACPNVGAIVRGDGEEPMEEFCLGRPLETIAGLSFRKHDRVTHNPNHQPGPLSDHLYPDRRLRRHPYHVMANGASTGLLIDLIAGSRGCPFNCDFCSFNRNPWGTKRGWSARSPESIVEELTTIDAPIVGFADDLFTFDMDRVDRICDLILASGIRKKYIVNARLEVARRPDVLRKMERAGFVMLMLGIESAHDKTLQSMHKGFTTKRIRESFQELRQSSMVMHGYFILGSIGESAAEMRQILPFARELGLDSIAISTLRSTPFSGLEELVAQSPGYHIAPGGKIYSDHCSETELKDMRRWIYREFFDTGQILRLARKALRSGGLRYLPVLAPHLPAIVWGSIRKMRQRAQRRALKEIPAAGSR